MYKPLAMSNGSYSKPMSCHLFSGTNITGTGGYDDFVAEKLFIFFFKTILICD